MFHFLELENTPVYEQLLIEESLLRADERNWCIVNYGAPDAIVMGISGKPEQLLNLEQVNIPVIKRYSGGGTVVVDKNTLFVSLICKTALHLAKPYPEPIMRWSESIYKSVICHPEFQLKENDFVLKNLKFGGNAQYIKKDRFVHHTTFLWDYDDNKMETYLKLPEKRPAYRQNRRHSDFLCRLKDVMPCKTTFIARLKQVLCKRHGLAISHLDMLQEVLAKPVRQSTRYVDVRSKMCSL